MDRLKKKVFSKFKKLGTKDFYIKMIDGTSINTEKDIVKLLLGQTEHEHLPKCSVFIGIPRFDEEEEDININATNDNINNINNNDKDRNGVKDNHDDDDDDIDESPISPLQSDINNNNNNHARSLHGNHNHNNTDIKCMVNEHNNNNKNDIYSGQREYLFCFNNITKKTILTMMDIAEYSHDSFKKRFCDLFDYKLSQNESLTFRIWHIETKQYIPIILPLWSYDCKHHQIEGIIKQSNNIQNDINLSFVSMFVCILIFYM